jgi:class 3 adenylate cyclase/TolB-like protein
MDTKDIDRKIAVIFATDAVGYSKHMEKDENQTLQSFETCNEILEKLLKKYGGSVFNTAGDSVLAEFPSAVAAVECGSDFQKEIKKRNASIDTSVKLEFRIGINMGDVVKKSGNLLGDGVNIAARLEALSQSNGISISKSVFDLVSNKTNLSFNDLGVQKVKDNEFHAFDVLLDPSQKRKLKTKSKSNVLLFTTIAVVLIIGLAGIVYYNSKVQVTDNNKTVLTADKPSVLVMPFENQTGKKGNDFIGMGITSNIISTLSLNEQLLIPSSNIGKFIQENNLSDDEIKEKYGIQYILRGIVQGIQGNFRVNVQMSDLSKKEMIWSKIYDFRNNNDLFEIQDELGNSILHLFNIKFSGGFDPNISRNMEVYKKFIYGQSAFSKKTIEGTYKAEKLWKEALALEPNNSRLGAFLGWIHWRKVTLGMTSNPKEDMEKAYEYAIEAMQKNETWANPVVLAGLIELFSGKHEVACARVPKLVELSRNVTEISMTAIVQHSCGYLEDTITSYERVFSANPHYSSWVKYMYAYALTENKDYEKAKEFCTEQLKQKHNWSGVEKTLYIVLAYIHKKQGSEKLAKEMFEMQRKKDGKGMSAQQIYKGFMSKKDKSFLNDIVVTLKPFGLHDK